MSNKQRTALIVGLVVIVVMGLFPPYTESTHKYVYGLPRLRRAEFVNHFPLHRWHFFDDDIPLNMSMEIFSPFIPLDVEQSSYPVAVFYWKFHNTSAEPVQASIVLNMESPIRGKKISNIFLDTLGVRGIKFCAQETGDVNYQGTLFMGTTFQDIKHQIKK